jgi:hypothetical protein
MDTTYYQKCVDLCQEQGWYATLTAIVEEGGEGDGTDWEALYRDWSNDLHGTDWGALYRDWSNDL